MSLDPLLHIQPPKVPQAASDLAEALHVAKPQIKLSDLRFSFLRGHSASRSSLLSAPNPRERTLLSDFESRENVLKRLTDLSSRDPKGTLLVIGGGIHGAQTARLASDFGWKQVVMLERSDYAGETSRASTKLAHGGYRYLAYGDFPQVLQALRERHKLFESAGPFVKAIPLLFPIMREAGESDLKVKARVLKHRMGLWLYDAYQPDASLRTEFIPRKELGKLNSPVFRPDTENLVGCFRLFDGQFGDDARFTHLCVLDARRKGALCTNYTEVEGLRKTPDGSIEVNWSDTRGDSKGSFQAEAVINCAGPWAPEFTDQGHRTGNSADTNYSAQVAYSRGVHLMFPKPLEGDNLFVPMPGTTDRFFFALNIPESNPPISMVGTTELKRSNPDRSPIVTSEEASDILRYMQSAPGLASLGEPFYAIAGVRTLRLESDGKNSAGSTSALSRDHAWIAGEDQNVLSLLGGKYTDAANTARQGLEVLEKMQEKEPESSPIREMFDGFKKRMKTSLSSVRQGAHVPPWKNIEALTSGLISGIASTLIKAGEDNGTKHEEKTEGFYPGLGPTDLSAFQKQAEESGMPKDIAQRLVHQFGSRVLQFSPEMVDSVERFGDTSVSNLEIFMFVATEQVETISDLFRGRLGLHYHPSLGLDILPDVLSALKHWAPEKSDDWTAQAEEYRKHVEHCRAQIAQSIQETNFDSFAKS